jgi:hypothetical protein
MSLETIAPAGIVKSCQMIALLDSGRSASGSLDGSESSGARGYGMQHGPSTGILVIGIIFVILGAGTWIWGAPVTRYLRQTYWHGHPSKLSWHRILGIVLMLLGVYFVAAWSLLGR